MSKQDGAREVQTICRCCSAGCGIRVQVSERGEAEAIRGDPEHPLSQGYICPKGYNLAWHHNRPDQLQAARVRGVETPWEAAVDDLAASVRGVVERHGAGVVASYNGNGNGSIDIASSLTVRALLTALGSRQIYTPMTVDHAPAWVAGDIVTGSGAELQPRWVPEDEASRLVVFVGCNPIVSHGYFTVLPNASRRIRAFRRRGGRVWTVDPRLTETAKASDGHLACLPGTDWLLLAWLLKELLAQPPYPQKLAESTRPEDLERLRVLVASVTRAQVAQRCDVDEATLQALLDDIRAAGRFALVTGSGSVFSDTGLMNELLRYAILAVTDSLDQPGGALFDLGYVSRLEERAQWSPAPIEGRRAPGPASRPELPSIFGELPCASLADEIEAGHIKALLVFGGNPLTALPDPDKMRAALAKLEVLAVVDIVETPAAPLATHLLPGLRHLEIASITAWNGQAVYAPAVVAPSGERGAVWKVCARIAEALGLDVLQGLSIDEASEDEILKRAWKGARFDLDTLKAKGVGGFPLPVPTGWVLKSGAVPDGRWRIASALLIERLGALLASDDPTGDGSLALICRRQNEHTNSMNYVRAPKRHDHPDLLMSPRDAQRLGLIDGQQVRITSPLGGVDARLAINSSIRPGAVSLPHGWAEANVSRLISTTSHVDPMTGQPAMTGVRVRVQAAEVVQDAVAAELA